jgi:predicted nucleic acid-binding protein
MLAVDTNVIVRYLTGDDDEQSAKANVLIGSEDVYVCTTVLLETEWVLRRGYRFSRTRIIAARLAFAGLPRVILEDAARTVKALDGCAAAWTSPMRCIWRRPRAVKPLPASTSALRQSPKP